MVGLARALPHTFPPRIDDRLKRLIHSLGTKAGEAESLLTSVGDVTVARKLQLDLCTGHHQALKERCEKASKGRTRVHVDAAGETLAQLTAKPPIQAAQFSAEKGC